MSGLRNAFGATLRELRSKRGISQEKLAQKAKVSRNFLGSVERGESSLSLEVADRISRVLGLPLHELLSLVESKRKYPGREQGIRSYNSAPSTP